MPTSVSIDVVRDNLVKATVVALSKSQDGVFKAKDFLRYWCHQFDGAERYPSASGLQSLVEYAELQQIVLLERILNRLLMMSFVIGEKDDLEVGEKLDWVFKTVEGLAGAFGLDDKTREQVTKSSLSSNLTKAMVSSRLGVDDAMDYVKQHPWITVLILSASLNVMDEVNTMVDNDQTNRSNQGA